MPDLARHRLKTLDDRLRAQDAARASGLSGDAGVDRVISELNLPSLTSNHREVNGRTAGQLIVLSYAKTHAEGGGIDWGALIDASTTDPTTHIALVHAASLLLPCGINPPELAYFVSDVLSGRRPQPSVRLTEAELGARDREITDAVRRETSRGASLGEAQRLVAAALLRLNLKPTSTRAVAEIWRRRDRPVELLRRRKYIS